LLNLPDYYFNLFCFILILFILLENKKKSQLQNIANICGMPELFTFPKMKKDLFEEILSNKNDEISLKDLFAKCERYLNYFNVNIF
jgi:hypothetical protein